MSETSSQSDPALDRLLAGWLTVGKLAVDDDAFDATLACAMETAAEGRPILPLGALDDVRALLVEGVGARLAERSKDVADPLALRRYEDRLLGKLCIDDSFARASDAVARYEEPRRTRAVAFVADRLLDRLGFAGRQASLASLKALRTLDPLRRRERIAELAVAIESGELTPDDDLTTLADAARSLSEALGPEDLLELERGTAVENFGHRVAFRLFVRTIQRLLDSSTGAPPRRPSERRRASSKLFDEDAYPVGGYSSIATRGSVESLLHSQLAFMDVDASDRPDLFDVRFLRDELYYYSRDENQFYRPRQTFWFAFERGLSDQTVRREGLPLAGVLMGPALAAALCQRLLAWLSSDSLKFRFVLLAEEGAQSPELSRTLLSLYFRDQIENGTATVETFSAGELRDAVELESRASRCTCLVLSDRIDEEPPVDASVDRLVMTGAGMILALDRRQPSLMTDAAIGPFSGWTASFAALLREWVGEA